MRDIIFKAQQVLTLQVIASTPAGSAVINQLHGNAHDSAHSLIAASQHRIHFELSRGKGRIISTLRILENGIGGAHGEILQRGKAADDGVGYADAPHLTPALPCKVTERQHGKRSNEWLYRGGCRGGFRGSRGAIVHEGAHPYRDNHSGRSEAGDNLWSRWPSLPIHGQSAAGFRVALQSLQVRPHINGMLITQFAVLLQRFVDDSFQIQRQVGVDASSRCRHTLQDSVKNDARGLAPKRQQACRHLVQHNPEGEQVCTRIQVLAPYLLWGHVVDRAQSAAGTSQVLVA